MRGVAILFALALAAACGRGGVGQAAPDSAPGAAPAAAGVPAGSSTATLAKGLSEAEKARCRTDGGTVQRLGMLRNEACVLPYADAGKSCTDSSQCLGRCQLDMRAPVPEGTVHGLCQPTTNEFGCFKEVRDGKVAFAKCVD